MTPERYQQVADIFHAASGLEQARRKSFLASACGADAELLREVESLLEAGGQAGDFMASGLETKVSMDLRLPAGRHIGHYRIESFLGAGGMGQVYLATDVRLGRKVALKILPASGENEQRLERFEAEARAASALNHPNIVTIYDVGRDEDGKFLVMEHVAGRTLRDLLENAPMPEAIPQVGLQLARALRAAHAGGITHRDIKPENIMVREDGFVKVLDFGLARLMSAGNDVTNESANGGRMGTVRYMSPEQAGGGHVDPPSDVFSLGIVFYEMATGRHPFPAHSTLGSFHAVMVSAPPRPSAIQASLRPGVERLILAMLKKDPTRRPTSAQVEAALEAEAGLSPAAHNLPVQRTPFVGREEELFLLDSMLRDPEGPRLVTLTGPGGTGKTRLALRAAENAMDAFMGGVYFADLAPLTEPRQVASAIAMSVGVRETADLELCAAIAQRLDSAGPVLLVLDNFEHLMEAASGIARLFERCATVKILATSRLPLHLYGEQEFPVPPLPLPAEDGSGRAMDFASIELFVQRAAAVRPGFALTAENTAAVAEICRRLDGLPLAIELAAARTKVLPPRALLARIENRLELLTGGSRDLPERHQALRRTIGWSYELLTPAERKLFTRLAVFVGGCTLEAAEAVCNTREDLEVDITEGISSLVDKSLIRQGAEEPGEPRFSMLETIRDYARERLASSGDMPETERAHAAYYLVLSEELAGSGPAQQEALAFYQREYGNVRMAIRHLIASGNGEWALRLGGAQLWFWEQVEYFGEGRELLEAILRMPSAQAPTALRARVAYLQGTLCYRLGDYSQALRLQEDEALAIFRQLGDRRGMASALIGVATIKHALKRSGEAMSLLRQAERMWREQGDDSAADYCLHNLARIAAARGEYATARGLLETIAVQFERRGDRRGAASAFCSLGDLAEQEGDIEGARAHQLDGLRQFEALGDVSGSARVLADLGDLARRAHNYGEAEGFYRDSLREAKEAARRTQIARALVELAGCSLLRDRPERALTLATAAASMLRAVASSSVDPLRQTASETRSAARSSLDQAAAGSAETLGRSFTLEQAIEYALRQD